MILTEEQFNLEYFIHYENRNEMLVENRATRKRYVARMWGAQFALHDLHTAKGHDMAHARRRVDTTHRAPRPIA